jgi:hypothetical protein
VRWVGLAQPGREGHPPLGVSPLFLSLVRRPSGTAAHTHTHARARARTRTLSMHAHPPAQATPATMMTVYEAPSTTPTGRTGIWSVISPRPPADVAARALLAASAARRASLRASTEDEGGGGAATRGTAEEVKERKKSCGGGDAAIAAVDDADRACCCVGGATARAAHRARPRVAVDVARRHIVSKCGWVGGREQAPGARRKRQLTSVSGASDFSSSFHFLFSACVWRGRQTHQERGRPGPTHTRTLKHTHTYCATCPSCARLSSGAR